MRTAPERGHNRISLAPHPPARSIPNHWISVMKTQAAFLLWFHLAVISVDNFFRAAELIGLRLAVLIKVGFFAAPELRFCLAHQAFFAAPILTRAAALN